MRIHRHVVLVGGGLAICAGLALASEACSSDETNADATGTDAATGTDTSTSPGNDSGGPVDSGGGGDASEAGTGAVTYTVPSGGGSVSVSGSTTTLDFAFPASAAGVTVTLKKSTPASIGWASEFTDVITMTPDGTTFTTPVIVTPGNKHLFLFSSPSGTGKQRLEALPLTPSGAGFELRHFSSLAIIDPAQSCSSTTGWVATPSDPACVRYGGANTTRLSYGCKALAFCQYIAASCCVPPGTTRTDCQLGDNNLYAEFVQNGGDSTSAAYCADAGPKPVCGTITTTGGTIADCSATLTVNGNVYVAACSSAGGQACTCTKNGALGGGLNLNAYAPDADTCAFASDVRLANCGTGCQ